MAGVQAIQFIVLGAPARGAIGTRLDVTFGEQQARDVAAVDAHAVYGRTIRGAVTAQGNQAHAAVAQQIADVGRMTCFDGNDFARQC